MSDARCAVVVGASAGVGRALAGELAGAGFDLIVSARSEADLGIIADDLRIRHGVTVTPLPIDLRCGDEDLAAYVRACSDASQDIVAAFFPAGMVDAADDGISSWTLSSEILVTNFLAISKLAGYFVDRFERDSRGTVVLFSSIAVAAPRSKNVTYGAAKRALESYGRSMQHRLAANPAQVQIYRLGYVDTAMSRGQKLLLPRVSSDKVAHEVIRHLDEERRLVHYPSYWRIAVAILGRLPWFLYKRLTF